MKKLLGLVGLIALVILSGCGVPAPDLEGQDWCYPFDFTKNPQGFQITSGTWNSQGILSDGSGLLQTSYGYDRFVTPSFVIVTVVRPAGITGDITATAAGTIFGLSATFTATLPDGIDSAPLTFQPEEQGQAGSDVNITIDASQPIGIQSLEIRGMGGSPFPFNSCYNGTPTQFPGMPTGTATATGTGTAVTSTATTAPDEPFCYLWDFTVSDGGWGEWDQWPGHHAGWTPAIGFLPISRQNPDGRYRRAVILEKEVTGTLSITYSKVTFEYEAGAYWSASPTAYAFAFGTTQLDVDTYNNMHSGPGYRESEVDVSGSGEFHLVINSSASILNQFDGDVLLQSIEIHGIGSTAGLSGGTLCSDPTPTSTPAPTNTPGPTATFEPLWQCVDFLASDYTFQGTNATWYSNIGWQSTAASWIVGRNGLGTGFKKKIKAEFGQAFTGDVRLTDGLSTATSYKTAVTGATVILDFSDQAWVPRTSLFVQFVSASVGPYTLKKLCWIDEYPYTPTPGPTTVGTRTPIASGTPRPAPSRTPINIPITSTAGVYITTTPIYGGTGTPVTGTPIGTPWGGGDGDGALGDVGDMVGFSWEIGWGLLGTIFAYGQQGSSMVTDLISAFLNATPQPIPGLPLCITNPMANDLCAIYYVMDNTVLAPATPGQYIVPLAQIIFNVSIAILFVRWVLRIIRRGESVTNVH